VARKLKQNVCSTPEKVALQLCTTLATIKKVTGFFVHSLPQYLLVRINFLSITLKEALCEVHCETNIASIKTKNASLITFITIVIANFESENFRKIFFTFARIGVYSISSNLSRRFRHPLVDVYQFKGNQSIDGDVFKLLTKESF